MRGVVMIETQIAREALPMDKTPVGIEVPMIEGNPRLIKGELMAGTEIMLEVHSDHDVVSRHEVLTGVSILAVVVIVVSDGHLDDMREEDRVMIGTNELAVVGCSSQPWSAVSSGIMMAVVSKREVLTDMDNTTVKEEEEGFVIGPNELAVHRSHGLP
ncbi:hypothetical protein FCV25MIE_28753 [Fagus crenata]